MMQPCLSVTSKFSPLSHLYVENVDWTLELFSKIGAITLTPLSLGQVLKILVADVLSQWKGFVN